MNRILQPIKSWSAQKDRENVKRGVQANLLGFVDDCDLYRLLREPEHIVVDPVTNEIWRKVKKKVKPVE